MKAGSRRNLPRRRDMRQAHPLQSIVNSSIDSVAIGNLDRKGNTLNDPVFGNIGAHCEEEFGFAQEGVVVDSRHMQRWPLLNQRDRHVALRVDSIEEIADLHIELTKCAVKIV